MTPLGVKSMADLLPQAFGAADLAEHRVADLAEHRVSDLAESGTLDQTEPGAPL